MTKESFGGVWSNSPDLSALTKFWSICPMTSKLSRQLEVRALFRCGAGFLYVDVAKLDSARDKGQSGSLKQF
jgi:hypothetical protein